MWRLHNTGFIPGYTEFKLGQFRDKNTKVTKNSSRIEMEKCLIGHVTHRMRQKERDMIQVEMVLL